MAFIFAGVGVILLLTGLIWLVAGRQFRRSGGLFVLYIGYRFASNPEQRVFSEGIVNGVSVTPWDRSS